MIYLSHFEKRDAPEAAGAPYPFGVPLIREFSALELTRPVTIFCGENGSGKTTLLELMAGQCGANRISAPDSQSTSAAALMQAARYFRGARTAKPRTVFLFSAETFTRYIEFLYAEKREAEALYAPYLRRQEAEMRLLEREERTRIPDGIDFAAVPGLSMEMRQRLAAARPATLGAAGRLPGVTPAAVAALAVALRRAGACST